MSMQLIHKYKDKRNNSKEIIEKRAWILIDLDVCFQRVLRYFHIDSMVSGSNPPSAKLSPMVPE